MLCVSLWFWVDSAIWILQCTMSPYIEEWCAVFRKFMIQYRDNSPIHEPEPPWWDLPNRVPLMWHFFSRRKRCFHFSKIVQKIRVKSEYIKCYQVVSPAAVFRIFDNLLHNLHLSDPRPCSCPFSHPTLNRLDEVDLPTGDRHEIVFPTAHKSSIYCIWWRLKYII